MTPPISGHAATDVAVVIPAHRCAAELDTTLASVAGQSRPPAEVVVADDASGDETPDVARAWADRLPIQVVERSENAGPGPTRRTAIEATSAPRIALLDADDVWMPDHLATMVELHDRHGGLITADVLRWIPTRGLATRRLEESLPVPPIERQRATILRHNFVFVGSLFDRALHDEAGGFRAFHGPEDWDLWIRMIRLGAPVHRPGHPTVLYRLSEGSISADSRMVAEEQRVIAAATEEATSAEDRAVLARTRRDLDAKAALYGAYALARDGRGWAARRAALGGLRGPGRIPSRCLALALAPGRAAAARDRRVHDPRWWLRV